MVQTLILCAFFVDRLSPLFDTCDIVESMTLPRFGCMLRAALLLLLPFCLLSRLHAQDIRQNPPAKSGTDGDHVQERSDWFLRGRILPGKSAAELRHKAYQAKLKMRASRIASAKYLHNQPADKQPATSVGTWTPLGPTPLASDATGDGFQNYNQVSGRATAVAIDPADPSGNTVYIGGAQGGVWKSVNAATSVANNVTWSAVTDDQATLSIGAIAIQPGNAIANNSVILVGTGEADNSEDSYFGLGLLRSADGGNSWALISTANGGSISFSGLGATRMAFSTANPKTVVAAMAATAVGETDAALTANTYRGLYTSTDAGQTWTYDSLFSGATESTSATSVVYNAAAGLFFAAVRYHGFYSSPDGLTWTRLANQPGSAGLLGTTNCPQNYSTACPIYRGEITVVPGRNEMYAWFVSAGPTDQGIWQSTNGGASWTQIDELGINVCGDVDGCGVEQGFYNLELLALPNGNTATDLYAGAINLYKCSITSGNPTCANPLFLNLTHVYGCDPLANPSHVHPDQHALAYTILQAGTDLMYFANDGGIYRALDGYSGLNSTSCGAANNFDDLNQNLGSMTQFVSFSQHPTSAGTILGGTQDNGSPATVTATTSLSWGNVLSGDGGYNAIDSISGDWFTSLPDIPPAGLNIFECPNGLSCTDFSFSSVVSSSDMGGDDGGFYFPYILDPQSKTSLLVGTCRVWSGPRLGGAFTELSLNFDTLGIGTCSGGEVNLIRALAAGGPANANGSQVIYATTDGAGPNAPTIPVGGNVWVTTNAAAISGVSSTFSNVTLNGPGGSSINPNQFPVSSVAIDSSDPSGDTAYVTIMGFTGGAGHVWQTTNAGATWTDWTGVGTSALFDSPTNAVVIDPSAHIIYVGTDVGVFQSPTSAPAWTEVGPAPSPQGGSTGFLPNVAVTALAIFNSSSQKLLRASTYGRGMWQFNLIVTPDFQITVPTSTLTAFPGTSPTFAGSVAAVDGYTSSVTLSCTAGASPGGTNPPAPCTPKPVSLTPSASGTGFTLTTGSAVGDYNFNLQGAGSDTNNTTHTAALTLQVVNFGLTTPSPGTILVPPGGASSITSFQATAQGSFDQSVTLGCSFSPALPGATCTFTPGAVVNPTATAPVDITVTVSVEGGAVAGNYTVSLQATTPGAPAPAIATFTLAVTAIQDFTIASSSGSQTVTAGQTSGLYNFTVAPAGASGSSFSGVVTLSCSGIPAGAQCNFAPNSVLPGTAAANVVLTIATNSSSTGGTYAVNVTGTSGNIAHSATVTLIVSGTFQLGILQPFSTGADAGSQQTAQVSVTPTYSGSVKATCDATSLSGQCSMTPFSPILITAGTPTTLTLTLNIPNSAAPLASNLYNINLTVIDISGLPTQNLTLPITVIQDFAMGTLTPATQTLNAGQTSGAYNFSVLPVGSTFAGVVALSCSSAPAISALCSFTPSTVTPGGGSAAVVMTIGTTASSANLSRRPLALWLLPLAITLLGGSRYKKLGRFRVRASLAGLFFLAILLSSCGGGGSNGSGGGGGGGGGGQGQGTQPGTYTITVTGTSGALSHQAAAVTLIVN